MYDEWVWYWFIVLYEFFVSFINFVKKYVVMLFLLEISWFNIEVVLGLIEDVVCDLCSWDGGDIGVYGSIELV